MDDLISDFLTETSDGLNRIDGDLLDLAHSGPEAQRITSILRELHTIKGNCGFVNLTRIKLISHHLESLVLILRDEADTLTPSRVGLILEGIDRMRVLLAHLSAHRAEPEGSDDDLLGRIAGSCAGHEPHFSDNPPARFVHIPPSTPVAGTQPIGRAWARLPYIVRSLSDELEKKIELVMSGGDTELDLHTLELIKAPLTQMIRNSGDHGIEAPAERLKLGKAETGTITLRASRQSGCIIMEIADDGRGLDLDRIRATAIARGLATASEVDAMNEGEIARFIFADGFTTTERAGTVSGRGIGMDIVKSHIEELGGSIELHSVAGQGSTFCIRIPVKS